MRLLSRYAALILGILSFIIIFAVWELSVHFDLINPFFVSSPTAILVVLKEQIITGELFA